MKLKNYSLYLDISFQKHLMENQALDILKLKNKIWNP